MAEKPDWVRDFDRPKGTEIKRIRGNWYLYERSWRYDPKIRRSRKVSGRYLGKITPGGLVPSAGRARRAEEPAVSDVVEVGASSLAWSLTGAMRERLAHHLPARWREVYALAVVRAVREPALRRSAAHLEDSALAEALGRPSLTPASVSSLLRDLGRNRSATCSYMRESLAADGCPCSSTATGYSPRRGAPTSPSSDMTPRRASARSSTSYTRSRSATTGRLPPTTSATPAAPPT